MTLTAYVTAKPQHTGGAATERINWYDGELLAHQNSVDFNLGAVGTWYRDTNWNPNNTNAKPHTQSAITISGNNKKSYLAIYEQHGARNGLFPPMKLVTGFQLDWKNNSTAGSAIRLARVGIETVTGSGAFSHRWSGPPIPWTTNYLNKTEELVFTEAAVEAMKNDYFYRLWFQLSSDTPGTGQHATEVTIGNFKLLYSAGTGTSSRWVVGKNRKKEVAFSESIQGK